MSSKSKSRRCYKCHEVETLPTRPLHKCSQCKARWHDCCHQPRVTLMGSTFTCRRCVAKRNDAASVGSSGIPTPATNARSPSLSFTSSVEKANNWISAQYVCEIAGCEALIQTNGHTSTRRCAKHEVGRRYDSPVKSSPFASKTAEVPRPTKDNLHNAKPDSESRSLKRKRSWAQTGGSINSANLSNDSNSSLAITRAQNIPHTLNTSDAPPAASQIKSSSAQKIQAQSRRSCKDPVTSARTGNRLFIKAAVDDLLEEYAYSWLREPGNEHLSRIPKSYAAIRNDSVTDVFDMSLYHAKAYCSRDTYDEDWLKSYIVQSVDAFCRLQFPGVPLDVPDGGSSPPNPQTPSFAGADPASHEAHEDDVLKAQSRGVVETEHYTYDSQDEEMSDAVSPSAATTGIECNLVRRAVVDAAVQTLSEYEPVLSILVEEPILILPRKKADAMTQTELMVKSTSSATQTKLAGQSTSSPTQTEMNTENFSAGTATNTPQAGSVGQQDTFDESVIDLYLAKQMSTDEYPYPSASQLVKMQVWGYIDPREVWPRESSYAWSDEKRQEIEARGGRKANFGKLLTTQVRKQRFENGWSIHQTKDAGYNERTSGQARHLEELFGIRGIGKFGPSVKDGRLIMVEKSVDENGRRKRKAALRILPVHG